MTNDDPMYVRQLEAARDAAEIEIKMLEDELKRCHETMGQMQDDLSPTHLGEPLFVAAPTPPAVDMEPVAYLVETGCGVMLWPSDERDVAELHCSDDESPEPLYSAAQLAQVQEERDTAQRMHDVSNTMWGEVAVELIEVKQQRDELLAALRITALNIRFLADTGKCITSEGWLKVVDEAIAKAEGT